MVNDHDAVARLRHELRTPLNHVIGYSEMLAEEFGDRRPELQPGLRRLHALGHDVLRLVNETLSSSRVEAGDLDVAGLEASAGRLVDEIVGLAEASRRHAESAGETRMAEDLERIAGSAAGLRTLLREGLTVAVPAAARASDTGLAAAVSDAPRPVPADAGSILVVDDDASNRDVLARRLVHEGHQVRVAADGHEALAVLAAEPFDLVLLDVMMPGIDGIEVLRRLKADEALCHVPVLMISALGDTEHVVRCIELGADDYMPKPFDPVLLRARIGACLEKKRLRDRERGHVAELAAWNRTLEARVADKVAEIEKLGRLERFVRPELAQAIMAGSAGDPLAPHRREIVAAFLDIHGFGAFLETAEPEEVIGVIREYHGAMGELIVAHEGTVENFGGDVIVVIFNDPVEVPDPAERAVRMAIAMQERFAGLAAGWRRRGWEMTLGIGIAQGFATIGAIGFAGRWDYAAMGRVMGLGSALCGAARTSGILVTTKVAGAVEALAVMAPADGIRISGSSRTIPAISVSGLKV
jgi:DNA-binding response OmpR family regulator